MKTDSLFCLHYNFGTPSKRLKRQVYKTSGLQNVRFKKCPVYKMSGLQNIRLQKKPPYIFCICGWWKSDVLKPDVLKQDVLKPDVLKQDVLWVNHNFTCLEYTLCVKNSNFPAPLCLFSGVDPPLGPDYFPTVICDPPYLSL